MMVHPLPFWGSLLVLLSISQNLLTKKSVIYNLANQLLVCFVITVFSVLLSHDLTDIVKG